MDDVRHSDCRVPRSPTGPPGVTSDFASALKLSSVDQCVPFAALFPALAQRGLARNREKKREGHVASDIPKPNCISEYFVVLISPCTFYYFAKRMALSVFEKVARPFFFSYLAPRVER